MERIAQSTAGRAGRPGRDAGGTPPAHVTTGEESSLHPLGAELLHIRDELERSQLLRMANSLAFPRHWLAVYDIDLRIVAGEGDATLAGADVAWQIGFGLQELIPAEAWPSFEPRARGALAGRTDRWRARLRDADVEVCVQPLTGAGEGRHLAVVTAEDAWERALEERLQVSPQLAALGTLVAGISHEVNNPLAVALAALGEATLEARDVQDGLQCGMDLDRERLSRRMAELLGVLGDATTGAHRVARIMKDLAAFTRPDPSRNRVCLGDLVKEAQRWLPRSLARGADIHVEGDGTVEVLASPGELGQVLVSLLTLALRSRPPEGRLALTVSVGRGREGMGCLVVADGGTGATFRLELPLA